MDIRPTSVTIIGWLLVLFGLIGALGSLALMDNSSNPLLLNLLGAANLSLLETIVMGWISAMARLACGVGLLRRLNGARYLLVVYGIAALAYGAYASGTPLSVIPGGLVFTVLVTVLFLPNANAWFGEKRDKTPPA